MLGEQPAAFAATGDVSDRSEFESCARCDSANELFRLPLLSVGDAWLLSPDELAFKPRWYAAATTEPYMLTGVAAAATTDPFSM